MQSARLVSFLVACLPTCSTCASLLNAEIHLATWKLDEFLTHILILTLLVVACVFMTFYARIPHLPDFVPQSLVLIILGVIFGSILQALKYKLAETIFVLTPDIFFNYLLPPIILDSAYKLYNRTFIDLTLSIIIFAVIGTVLNFLIIGPLMFGLHRAGAMGAINEIPINVYLLFASIIVAVDPVAVLAIFQEIGVNQVLYYTVFGESLFNDAVTVVLYEIMRAFVNSASVEAADIGLGLASFFTISLGGFAIGLIFGIASCIITRWSSNVEAVFLITMAYFSYIMTDCVGWSGIISMIACGLVQAAYAFSNIAPNSLTTLRGTVEEAAGVSESVIFFYIGIQLFSAELEWSTGFCLWGFFACLLARAVVVLVLAQIINCLRINSMRIRFREQAILIYGGLRGAVAFSLVFLVEQATLGSMGKEVKRIMVTGTLFIILATVGIQGLTMRPLTRLVHVKLARKKQLSIFDDLVSQTLDHSLSGVEAIVGALGRYRFRGMVTRLDEKVIRKILQRDPECYDHQFIKTYEKVALQLHLATVKPSANSNYLEDLPDAVVRKFLNEEFPDASVPETDKGQGDALDRFYVITDAPFETTKRRKSSLTAAYLEPPPLWVRPTTVCSGQTDGAETFQKSYMEALRKKSINLKQWSRGASMRRDRQEGQEEVSDSNPTNARD